MKSAFIEQDTYRSKYFSFSQVPTVPVISETKLETENSHNDSSILISNLFKDFDRSETELEKSHKKRMNDIQYQISQYKKQISLLRSKINSCQIEAKEKQSALQKKFDGIKKSLLQEKENTARQIEETKAQIETLAQKRILKRAEQEAIEQEIREKQTEEIDHLQRQLEKFENKSKLTISTLHDKYTMLTTSLNESQERLSLMKDQIAKSQESINDYSSKRAKLIVKISSHEQELEYLKQRLQTYQE